MYEFIINNYTVCEVKYSPLTEHKWHLYKYVKVGEQWLETRFIKFHTLNEARSYCMNLKGVKNSELD